MKRRILLVLAALQTLAFQTNRRDEFDERNPGRLHRDGDRRGDLRLDVSGLRNAAGYSCSHTYSDWHGYTNGYCDTGCDVNSHAGNHIMITFSALGLILLIVVLFIIFR